MKEYFRMASIVLTVMIAVIYNLSDNMDNAHSEVLNVYEKIAEGRTYHYLIIGDSIGRSSGAESQERRWFNQLEVLVKDRYGADGRRQAVVQSGATAFEGIYKLQKASRSEAMDLIFIVFGENDRKYMDPKDFSFFYEKLLNNARTLYPTAEVITFIESSLKQENYAEVIRQLSAKYGAKSLDMRIPFQNSGKLTEQLTTDTIHPNGLGYQLYASTVFEYIDHTINREPASPSKNETLEDDAFFQLDVGTKIASNKGFLYDQGLYVSNNAGDVLEYDFSGTMLGVNTVRNPAGGTMNVYIDGKFIRTISTWWPFTRDRHIYITRGLDNTQHTVRFEAVKGGSANNRGERSILKISSIIVEESKNNSQ
jgi:lysophospholipase L1-like esterase